MLGIAENRFAGEVELKTKEKKDYIYILTAKEDVRKQLKNGFQCNGGRTKTQARPRNMGLNIMLLRKLFIY